MTFAFPLQNFLAGSASNIGAWILEQRCQALYHAASAAIGGHFDCCVMFQILLDQVTIPLLQSSPAESA